MSLEDRRRLPGSARSSRAREKDPYALRRRRMVEEVLVARGIRTARVLEAMAEVPRHLFVEEALAAKAYGDHSLPIGCGQTISQPHTVARMTELLDVGPEHRVLELGTGSGYQTAVLARLARHVYSVERLRPLAEQARRNLRRAGVVNVSLRIADGTLGWEDRGPFDRILAAAGAPAVPPALLAQLAPSGKLVLPVGDERSQRLMAIWRKPDGSVVECDEGTCAFVKLVGRQGWKA